RPEAAPCGRETGAAGRRPGGRRRQHLRLGSTVPRRHPPDAARVAHQPAAGGKAARRGARCAGARRGGGRQHAARFLERPGRIWLLPASGDGVRPRGRAVPDLRHAREKYPPGPAGDVFLPKLPEIVRPALGADAIFKGIVGTSFNEQFDQHGTWRREFALRLKSLSQWLKDHDLLDAAVEERLRRLETQLRSEKVMVAFVAEFSRGKSELINAIFFAGYKRRIMPASAGRTTMCPTELGWDADVPPCLRLLPIETRLQSQPLMEWRAVPEKWTRVDLDVRNPAQLATAFEKVAEVRHVTRDEARALGFWHDDSPENNPMVNSEGSVEVPRWRHALINIAHP